MPKESFTHVIEGETLPPAGPAHFGTPVPDSPSQPREDATQEDLIEAIDRHCYCSARQLEKELGAASSADREHFLSSPHIPNAIRESLRNRLEFTS